MREGEYVEIGGVVYRYVYHRCATCYGRGTIGWDTCEVCGGRGHDPVCGCNRCIDRRSPAEAAEAAEAAETAETAETNKARETLARKDR